MPTVRLEHTGTTHIIQFSTVTVSEDRWLYMILRTLWQICTMSMTVSFVLCPVTVISESCNPNSKYRYHTRRLVSLSVEWKHLC